MTKNFTELKIYPEFIVESGKFILSPGGTQIYQVLSAPLCQLYWQEYDDKDLADHMRKTLTWGLTPGGVKVSATPWKTESGWTMRLVEGKEDWQKKRGNFPSYLVSVILDGTCCLPKFLTMRWVPRVFDSLEEAHQEAEICQAASRLQEVRPEPLPQTPEILLALSRMAG